MGPCKNLHREVINLKRNIKRLYELRVGNDVALLDREQRIMQFREMSHLAPLQLVGRETNGEEESFSDVAVVQNSTWGRSLKVAPTLEPNEVSNLT